MPFCSKDGLWMVRIMESYLLHFQSKALVPTQHNYCQCLHGRKILSRFRITLRIFKFLSFPKFLKRWQTVSVLLLVTAAVQFGFYCQNLIQSLCDSVVTNLISKRKIMCKRVRYWWIKFIIQWQKYQIRYPPPIWKLHLFEGGNK